MKKIIITGPSGSGKSRLSNKLSKLFDNTIIIRTDSYYRDCIFIKLLSIFKIDIYDRLISIKKKEIDNILNSIEKKAKSINSYYYDFKQKKSLKSKIELNYNVKNQVLIIEGIFAHRLNINYNETINIVCKEKKEICFNRRLKRDQLERGRNIIEINKRFNKSWYLFSLHIKNYLNKNKVIQLNPSDADSYDNLIFNLKNL